METQTTTRSKSCVSSFLKDKNGCYSLRELIMALLTIAMLISWVAQQFAGKNIPEFIFYSFVSLVGAGCFGYTIEKKTNDQTENKL